MSAGRPHRHATRGGGVGSRRSSGAAGRRCSALTLALGLLSQCTALSDFEVHQCEIDADCDALGAALARCEASRCVPGCANNAHCAAVDPRFPLCQAESGECVSLTSEAGECYASVGYDEAAQSQTTLEDLFVVGAFAPTVRSSLWLTAQLAVDEINAQGGLPQRGGMRPLVVVLCDGGERLAASSVQHLAGRLRAPALLASLHTGSLEIALDAPSARTVSLLLSPNGSIDPRAGDVGARSVWYLGADYRDVVPAYAPLVRQLAELVQAGGNMTPVRVAALIGPELDDQELAAAVLPTLDIDGAPHETLLRRGQVDTFSLPDELEAAADYRPHIVLWFAGGLWAESPHVERARQVERLEQLGSAREGWAPFYVLSPRNVYDAALQELARRSPSFRARALGLHAERLLDPAVAGPLATRFDTRFPRAELQQEGLTVSYHTYDAVYYLAYALAAASHNANAERVADGMLRVTDPASDPVQVGPGRDGLDQAVQLLRSSTAFDLHGTTGPARFDATRGVRSSPVRAVCWDERGELTDGGSYNAKLGEFSASGSGCTVGLSNGDAN
jgi:hypothetical protein